MRRRGIRDSLKLKKRLILRCDSKKGFIASCLTSYVINCKRFRVYGTVGQLESEPFQSYRGNHLWQVDNGKRTEVPYEPVNHFAAEMDDFSGCILNDKTSLTPGEEGLKDMKVMMAAYQSAKTGQAVKIA